MSSSVLRSLPPGSCSDLTAGLPGFFFFFQTLKKKNVFCFHLSPFKNILLMRLKTLGRDPDFAYTIINSEAGSVITKVDVFNTLAALR